MELTMEQMIQIIEQLGIIATAITTIFFLLGKIKETNKEEIIAFVQRVVNAMEMIFTEKGQGAIKKENATKEIKKAYPKLADGEISILIESAVCELKETL